MTTATYKTLLGKPGFVPYLWAQFLGALNDNAFKMVLSLMAVNQALTQVEHNVSGPMYSSWLVSAIGAVFILPYLLFSGYAGYFADVYNKRMVLILTKALEVFAMVLALIVLPTNILWLGMMVLFLMATQSTFLGPAKYGILPEIFSERQLARANGLVEMATFVAIIFGTFIGAALFDLWGAHKERIGVIMVVIAIVGWVLMWWVPRVPSSGAQRSFPRNPWRDIGQGMGRIYQNNKLRLIVIGIGWFWFLGALLQLTLLLLSKEILKLDDFHTGLILTSLAVGIGAGSLLAGKLSSQRIELGLVPLGALGIGGGAAYFALGLPSYVHAVFALMIIGLAGGLFIIPLNASLQQLAGRQEKGALIATANFILTIGILMASAILPLFHDILGLGSDEIIVLFCLMTVVATGCAIYLLPEVLVRFLLWLLTHSIYRINVRGLSNVPKTGPALLVANHLSYADGLLVGAALNRHVRFMLLGSIYNIKFLKPLFRLMGVIPVRSGRQLLDSLEEAKQGLKNGDLVCIFAEGGISRTGNILPFKRGLEKIVAETQAPIIPVHLDGVWGSIFSFYQKRFFFKWPRHFPYPVTLSFGHVLPRTTPPHQIRQKIVELGAEAFPLRKSVQNTLPQRFIKSAKKRWRRLCMADVTGRQLNFGQTLVAAMLLSDQVSQRCKEEQAIGLLFPASIGGALANLGVSLLGKTAINLNFTTGTAALASSLAQAQLRTIITSRKFMKAQALELDPALQQLFIEDLMQEVSSQRKILKTLKCFLLPWRLLWWSIDKHPISPQSVATVIFSSGSTGVPKGILLSHQNILCNLEGVAQVFPHTRHDRFLGVLPFFHSFGFTETLWFPLLKGLGVVFHHNPIDAKAICKLFKKYRLSFLISTPTFYRAYLRGCKREHLASLKYAIVGAEKLHPTLAQDFKAKFGAELFEGYGCTEMSPVVAVNTPDIKLPGWRQVGHQFGSVGLALPGIATKVVDPETLAPLPTATEGMLLVKGGNCMLEYLNQPEQTQAAFTPEGWYITGDIAKVDARGFITIVDRLSRFSKIGGEMVPHLKIEEMINQILGSADSVVVSIPDKRKGEQLAVVYNQQAISPQDLWKQLNQTALPKLWLPKPANLLHITGLPLLANGKIDLQRVKQIAMEQISND